MTNQTEINGKVYATDNNQEGLYLYIRRGKWKQLADSSFTTRNVKHAKEKIKRYVIKNIAKEVK